MPNIVDDVWARWFCFGCRGIKGAKGDSLFTACVSELVLESRNFDLLLGKLEPNGCRTLGFLNHFKGTQVDVQKIIELVARDSEAKGLFEDAVHLYELARDDHKVIELLCRLLGNTVAQPAAVESQSWRLQNRALAVAQRLKTSGSLLPDLAATFFLLLDLGIFFSLYHQEKYADAFEVISKSAFRGSTTFSSIALALLLGFVVAVF